MSQTMKPPITLPSYNNENNVSTCDFILDTRRINILRRLRTVNNMSNVHVDIPCAPQPTGSCNCITVDPQEKYIACDTGDAFVNIYDTRQIAEVMEGRCEVRHGVWSMFTIIQSPLRPLHRIETDTCVLSMTFTGGGIADNSTRTQSPKRKRTYTQSMRNTYKLRLHNFDESTLLAICTRTSVRLFDVLQGCWTLLG
jgi:hypothetical protein